jgi:hypothetical protein
MFESLNMMIPFSALMTAAMALLPPISVPESLSEAVTAPCAGPGQPPGTLPRHATHHRREGSPKLWGHYGPTGRVEIGLLASLPWASAGCQS